MTQMTHRAEIEAYLNSLLRVDCYKDYGPNGMQVEGKPEVGKVISGVTSSLALIEAAVAAQADAILVHHGLFWRGQDGRVTGWMKRRLEILLAHQINLFAYHLPLDAHEEFGNNAQLGKHLGLNSEVRFGEQDLGFLGAVPHPLSTKVLADRIEVKLARTPLVVAGDGRPLKRIAWCSGGAQSYFEAAIRAGADVFITGEISEPQAHLAAESGVAFIACGHHASERYGASALGAHLAERYGLQHDFIDINNPA